MDFTTLSDAEVSLIFDRNCSPNNLLSIGDMSRAFLADRVSLGIIRALRADDIILDVTRMF